MFGKSDHCFVSFDNNVKLDKFVLFVFLCLVFFYNVNNVNVVLVRPRSHYGCIGTEQLSRYVVKFF